MSVLVAVDERLIFCSCGCGVATNERHLAMLAMRERGATVQEIADEFDVSQGSASNMLNQARRGDFPYCLRGHALRPFDPNRKPTTTKTPAPKTEHDHQWQVLGTSLIGGVRFRIDVCVGKHCRGRRACRMTGPGATPAPS